MNYFELAEVILFFAILLLLIKPFGVFMARVFQGERTFLTPMLTPCENLIYRVCGVDRNEEMGWQRYAWAMILFNFAGFITLFVILLLQGYLPLNPQKFPAFHWHLALNTAVSFTTNTNWQNYSGESAASYFTQMFGFAVHNFVSAATGMVIAIALIRGFVRRKTSAIGNFWVDLTRSILYILLPLSLIFSIFLVSQGVIQNFSPYKTVPLVQATSYDKLKLDTNGSQITGKVNVREVTMPMGPVASQEAIKEFGTNGGGFFNANSSHPFENPTPISHFGGNPPDPPYPRLAHVYLRNDGGKYPSGVGAPGCHAGGVGCFIRSHAMGRVGRQPAAVRARRSRSQHGREGNPFRPGRHKPVRTATTGTSCGAVNTMHDSLTPLGGMMPLALILLSEVIFGGVGTGLYTMLAFVVIAVFVAGLMIGRTPEFLGKKIEVREMWMSIVTVLASGILVLIFTAVAMMVPAGVSSMNNPGAHGLSEVLYAFASMSNNNGSAFAGLNGNTIFYNLTGAAAMIMGRFAPAVAVLAMAGSLAEKKYVPPSLGTLPTDKVPFAFWLTLVILIVGALTFFPALSLGPIVEHLTMLGGK